MMKDISDWHGKKKGKENSLNLLLKTRTEEDHLFEMGTGAGCWWQCQAETSLPGTWPRASGSQQMSGALGRISIRDFSWGTISSS